MKYYNTPTLKFSEVLMQNLCTTGIPDLSTGDEVDYGELEEEY